MNRARIIVHGDRADLPLVNNIVEHLRARDPYFIDVRPTWEAGDALAIAAESAAVGVDLLIAAGGDGLLHQVINGVAHLPERPAIGLIPLGTANDFGTTAGLQLDDPEALADVLCLPPRPVDLVRAQDRFFVNVATGGFAVSEETAIPGNLKSVFGGLAYLLSGVANLSEADAQSVTVRGDGFEWSGSFYGFAIANARCAGGGHRVAPEAIVDDGALDVVIVPSDESIFQSIRIGADLTVEADERFAQRWHGSWVEVEGEDLRLNLDGEPHTIRGCVRFESVPGHVQMCLPDGPLFSET